MDLIPLQRSAEFDDFESELKALCLSLYQAHIAGAVKEANTLGMPHLGPDTSISRALNNDGLALLNDTTSARTRALFKAWRYLNPQRGTSFLAYYLRALFGDVFTIDQLWCKKAERGGSYPEDSMTEDEIRTVGEQLADYFLTSRLRVDIETDVVPERVLKAAQTAVAARFVLELRAARRSLSSCNIGAIAYSVNVCRTAGTALYNQPAVISLVTAGPASIFGSSSLTYSHGTQSHLL